MMRSCKPWMDLPQGNNSRVWLLKPLEDFGLLGFPSLARLLVYKCNNPNLLFCQQNQIYNYYLENTMKPLQKLKILHEHKTKILFNFSNTTITHIIQMCVTISHHICKTKHPQVGRPYWRLRSSLKQYPKPSNGGHLIKILIYAENTNKSHWKSTQTPH